MSQPIQQPPPQPSPFPPIMQKPKKPWFKRWWAIVLFIVVGLLALSALINPSGDTPTTAAPTPTVTVTATSASTTGTKAPEPTAAPKPEPTKATQAPKPKPKEPQLTAAQENAVGSAQSYLETSAFSKKGLIEQLKYEEYSTKDAEFAVEYLEKKDLVDWNEEAAESAESYLDSGNFSRSGLIQQLKYEGFTQKQAEYGVKQAGL